MSEDNALRRRYENAVSQLVEKLEADRLVLAVILCGSLSHDEIWKKSDIDMTVVTTDDLKEQTHYALTEDDINFHVWLMPRRQFVSVINGSLQGSFLHSYLSKGKPLFSRDQSLVDLFGTLSHLGKRDREIAMMRTVMPVFPALDKAEKWLFAKRDPIYCFFWIMKLVDSMAQLEVLYHGEIPGREVIQHAKRLNPEFIRRLYEGTIEEPKTIESMESTLALIREQLLVRTEAFAPLIEYLREAEGPRRASEINHDFKRKVNIDAVDSILEWLTEQGLVQKLSLSARLMPKSRVSVEEIAYTA